MGDHLVVDVLTLTNEDRRFYPLVGPFLANRDVVRDCGVPPWDDPGKRWFVAVHGGRCIGFCGLRYRGDDTAILTSAYVVPDYRGQGVYDLLFRERLDAIAKGVRMRSTVTLAARGTFSRYRFVPMRSTKNYTVMEKVR